MTRKCTLLGILIAAISWLGPVTGNAAGAAPSSVVPAPAFSLVTLTGERLSTADLPGRVTLINFWATWCAPCAVEVPDLVGLQAAHRDRVRVIGVSVDEVDRRSLVEEFVVRQQVNYPVALADDAVIAAFRVVGVPMSVVIDGAGNVVKIHRGRVSRSVLEADVRTLVGLLTRP